MRRGLLLAAITSCRGVPLRALLSLVAASLPLTSCSTCVPRESRCVPAPTFDREAERAAVYGVVLEELHRDKATRQFVVGTTLLPGTPISKGVELSHVQNLLGHNERILHGCVVREPPDRLGAGASTIADWRARLTPSPTPRTIRTALPTYWITDAEWDGFFDPEGDLVRQWTRVQARFPDSSGRVILSDVGFSPSGEEAVLFTSRMRGGLDGFGAWVLLRRSAGRWSIANRVNTWMS